MKKFLSSLIVAVTVLSTMLIGFNAFATSVCSVTYNVNTNDSSVYAPASQTVEYGGVVILSEQPVRPGYTMTEWNTSANGNGVSFEPGDCVTLATNLTLYAIWSETWTPEETTVYSFEDVKTHICDSIRNIISQIWLYLTNICDHIINADQITLKLVETTSATA